MLDEPPDPPPRLLFGKITPANANATLNRIAIVWSVMVAVQIFEIGASFGIDELPCIVIMIHLWSVAGAYFVRSRKSRAVAIAQVVYAMFFGLTTFVPIVQEKTPLYYLLWLLLFVFMAGMALCAAYATWIYDRAANSSTGWKRILTIVGLIVIIVPGVLFGTIAIMDLTYGEPNLKDYECAVMAAWATLPLIMGLLTWKFPFAKRDMGRNVAEVFE